MPSESGFSIEEYARHRKKKGLKGTSWNAVKRAVDSGRISLNTSGRIDDFDEADRNWERQTAPTHFGRAPENSKSKNRSAQPSETPNYQAARAKKEEFQARIAELDYLERIGELVKIQEIESLLFKVSRTTRDAILNIPAKISHKLASLNDPHELELLLQRELNDALRELTGRNLNKGGL